MSSFWTVRWPFCFSHSKTGPIGLVFEWSTSLDHFKIEKGHKKNYSIIKQYRLVLTIRKPDKFDAVFEWHSIIGPFGNRTQIYHLKTGLIRYSVVDWIRISKCCVIKLVLLLRLSSLRNIICIILFLQRHLLSLVFRGSSEYHSSMYSNGLPNQVPLDIQTKNVWN
jgi:hypothetical protein